mmetsp:Transcript_5990/g.21127  ORF Transcript_5990/g.21127 Transcript_5990/m.21127 type:complete len:87 (+) Transcript_5990:1027-1287(+)
MRRCAAKESFVRLQEEARGRSECGRKAARDAQGLVGVRVQLRGDHRWRRKRVSQPHTIDPFGTCSSFEAGERVDGVFAGVLDQLRR